MDEALIADWVQPLGGGISLGIALYLAMHIGGWQLRVVTELVRGIVKRVS